MLKYTVVYFNCSEMWMRLSAVNRNKPGCCQLPECVFCANSLCKSIFRWGRAHARNTCNKHNSSFSSREREQYIQCAAGNCVDRTAAGSEMQQRAEREDSFIIHKEKDGWKLVLKLLIDFLSHSRQIYMTWLPRFLLLSFVNAPRVFTLDFVFSQSVIIFPNLEYPF